MSDKEMRSSDQSFVCAACRNVFLQPPECTTCGAEKLYDATVRQQADTIVAQEHTIADLIKALTDLGDWLSYGLAKADGAEPTAEDLAACECVAANARAAIERAKS